jgi:hypothetical protein
MLVYSTSVFNFLDGTRMHETHFRHTLPFDACPRRTINYAGARYAACMHGLSFCSNTFDSRNMCVLRVNCSLLAFLCWCSLFTTSLCRDTGQNLPALLYITDDSSAHVIINGLNCAHDPSLCSHIISS